MKIQLQLAAAFAALLMTSNSFPAHAVNADRLFWAASSPNHPLLSDSPLPEGWETVSSGDSFPSSEKTDPSAMTAPDEAPSFCARIEYSNQGYTAMGTFTEFLPDTSLVQPLYSLDGETWQICDQMDWSLQYLGSDTVEDIKMLQNQRCLFGTSEPLDSYLSGKLDRFYLKLLIALDNGITYETQAAVIERGDPQPLPQELSPVASFASAILVRQWRPFKCYGQYQITVSADATPEDISALLPDTVPINVQLYQGINFVTDAAIECPVTWKPLSLPQLTAGESVTITDAAEEMAVPADTLLNTPTGVFELNEPLSIEHDSIKLILNVVATDAEPTGVLSCEIDGLQISFHLKPTGATDIRAYTFSEGGTDWVELPTPLLPEVNAPSFAANSTYTYVLRKTVEPYQSYLAVENAGAEPAPFFVGMIIEGGVYDGRQLILAWPDNYELPARLPDLKGAGGNECNAGSDNKNDSTPEGQRPGLPHQSENEADIQDTPPQDQKSEPAAQEPQPPQDQYDELAAQEPQPPQDQYDEPAAQEPQPPQDQYDEPAAQEPQPPQDQKNEPIAQEPQQNEPHMPEVQPQGQPDAFLEPEVQPDLIQSFMTEPTPIAGSEDSATVSAVNAKIGSSAWEKASHRSEHLLRRLLLLAATTIVTGVCIAVIADRATASGLFSKTYRKIIRRLRRLLHQK